MISSSKRGTMRPVNNFRNFYRAMITSFFPWQAKNLFFFFSFFFFFWERAKNLSCHVSIQKVKSKEIKASAPPEFWRMKATNWFGVGLKWDDLMIWVKRDLKIVRSLFSSRAQKRWFVQALHDCSLDGSWPAPAQVDMEIEWLTLYNTSQIN